MLEKKGQIIGGNLKARKEIVARIIGSEIEVLTRLQVGMDDELLKDIMDSRKGLEEAKVDLKKVNEAIDSLKYTMGIGGEKNVRKEMFLNKCLETKKQHISKIASLEQKIKGLYLLVEELKNSSVSGNQIYPGTNIRISNSHYTVKRALSNSKLYMGTGRIEISSIV